MTVSQVPGVAKRKMMVGVMVLPQRNILAGVGSYFVNGIGDQTGMFCNVLRIVSSVVADWMYGVLAS